MGAHGSVFWLFIHIIHRPSIHQPIYDPVLSLLVVGFLAPYPQLKSTSSLQPENLIWTCSHRMVSAEPVSKFQRDSQAKPALEIYGAEFNFGNVNELDGDDAVPVLGLVCTPYSYGKS